MGQGTTTFVGMDAHKEAISVAMLLPGETRPVEWQCRNERTAVRRLVKKVKSQVPGEIRFCYEAGPCGYALQRWIEEEGTLHRRQRRRQGTETERGS
jgi:hypothetical protein